MNKKIPYQDILLNQMFYIMNECSISDITKEKCPVFIGRCNGVNFVELMVEAIKYRNYLIQKNEGFGDIMTYYLIRHQFTHEGISYYFSDFIDFFIKITRNIFPHQLMTQ